MEEKMIFDDEGGGGGLDPPLKKMTSFLNGPLQHLTYHHVLKKIIETTYNTLLFIILLSVVEMLS